MSDQFIEKSMALTKSITRNVEDMDEEMNKSLIAAFYAIQEAFEHNRNMTRDQLIQLAHNLSITTISLFDKLGHFYLTTGRALDPSYEHYWYYKDLCVTSLEECDKKLDGHEVCKIVHNTFIKSLANPSQIMTLPMFYSTPRKVPSKWLISYNSNFEKIIDLSFSDEKLIKILEENIDIHKGYLLYLALRNQDSDIIMEGGDRALEDAYSISLPYGPKWSFQFENKDLDYGYVIEAIFSKKELQHQVLIVRLFVGMITTLAFSLIYSILSRALAEKKALEIQRLSQEVHHDISQTIGALEGFADRTEDQQLNEEYVHNIKDIVWSLKAISDNLLTDYYSRIETESTNPEMISTIINKIVRIYQRQYSPNKLQINFIMHHEQYGIFCKVNQSEIERIIANLITNAIEATPEDQKVSINIWLERSCDYAIIVITDTGIGMSTQVIEALKAEKNFTNKPGGRGIGLSYVLQTVRKYQGKVLIAKNKKNKDQGTKITITIPVCDPLLWFIDEIKLEPDSILVIADDSPHIHDLWQTRLQDHPKVKKIIHCSTITELKAIIAQEESQAKQEQPYFYIIDNHFKLNSTNYDQGVTGIEIIQHYDLYNKAILCTARILQDKYIIRQSRVINIKILPKDYIQVIDLT